MIRLIIAFLFLALSSLSHATKTYYYYSTPKNFCSSVPDTVCQSYNRSDSVSSLTYAGQYNINNNEGYLTCGFNSVQFDYFGPGKHHTQYFQPPFPNIAHALKNQIVCQDTDQFVLDGCNAKCIADPCAALKDQLFTKEVTCGTVSCVNGGIIQGTPPNLSCSKGVGIWTPTPAQATSNNQCSGTFVSANTPSVGELSQTIVSNTGIGQSSTTAYCDAVYRYTGSSGIDDSLPRDLVNLSFTGLVPTTEDGQCPDGYKKGSYSYGENSPTQWTCIPDTPTENQCTAPLIKDNNGQCVDPKDAGQCEAGQVRDASGACVTPNPDGGGSGDSGDSGSGGSGNSGGTGGTGGTGGNNDGSNNDPNSLPEKTKGELGSGSKATASTAEGCTTAPPCSGDPLQCASFIQDWKQNCQMMSISQGDADKANTLATASNNEFKQAKTEQEQKVTGFFGDFKNTANASLSSGQCPDNVNLSVMGKQMTLKFSESCFFWRLLRALVIASAYLAAASIVFRSLA